MTIKFLENLVINSEEWQTAPLRFFSKNECIPLNFSRGASPSWQDIIISGNGSLTLANAKADGLNYLKLFGECEQPASQSKTGTAYVINDTTGVATNEFSGSVINANLSLLRSGAITSPATPSGIISDVDFTQPFTFVRENVIFTSTPNETIDICSIHTNTTITGIAKWVYTNGTIKAYSDYGSVSEYTGVTNITLNQPYSFKIAYSYNSALSKWRLLLSIKEPNSEYYTLWVNSDVTLSTDVSGYANILLGNGTGFSSNISDVSFTNNSVLKFGVTEVSTPTPTTPLDIVCNNGVIKADSQGQIYTDGTVETVEVNTTGDTATAEMLLAVGLYKDEQSVLAGAVTRNVGIKVLDGSEEWVGPGSTPPATVLTNCYTLRVKLGDGSMTDRTVYATHFNHASTLPSADAREGYALLGNTTQTEYWDAGYYLGIGGVNTWSTVALFKQWLAQQYANGTPVIVVYPKSSATTESVTPQTLTTQAGTNTIEITQASIDNLPLEASYKGTV